MQEVQLRKLQENDLTALVKHANNKKIWSNLRDMFPHPYSESDGRNFITITQDDEKNYRFAITYGGHFAGMIGLFPQTDVYKYNAEIGYWLGEEFWGKGVATRAVQQIVEFGFKETEIQRIFAGIFAFNTPSMRVLEKNGFTKEGLHTRAVFKDNAFYDEVKYAIVKSKPGELS